MLRYDLRLTAGESVSKQYVVTLYFQATFRAHEFGFSRQRLRSFRVEDPALVFLA